MPWTIKDVPQHVKGLTPHQAQVWVAAANNALAECEKSGGSNCDATAIRIANAAAQKVKESGIPEDILPAAQLLTVFDTLSEAGRVISNVNEQRLRAAIAQLQAVLAQLIKEEQAEGDGSTPPAASPAAPTGAKEALAAALGEGIAVLSEVQLGRPHETEESEPAAPYSEDDLVALREAGAIDVDGEVIPLGEAALREDGTFPMKIIQPGWGASGYYEAEALKRDGPRVFRAGTHMFADHPSKQEERDRPERSVRELAAVLTEDAHWRDTGPQGPGLYAQGRAFTHWRPFLEELAPHTGVSIRALGKGRDGVREGRKGMVIEGLVAAKSIDFVTAAGAGGRMLQLYESARAGSPPPPLEEVATMDEQELTALREANQILAEQAGERVARLAALEEKLLLKDAADFARRRIQASRLPEPTKERLLREALRSPAVKDGALDEETFGHAVDELLKEGAAEFEAIVGSGQVRGMGNASVLGESTRETSLEEAQKELIDSFVEAGMTADAARLAVVGRG